MHNFTAQLGHWLVCEFSDVSKEFLMLHRSIRADHAKFLVCPPYDMHIQC